ncbi:colicin E3/pyocin S6 family cytotoxin [Methylobacterium sp. 2A]|jgi:Cytotoxic|uniref:colicin E3/pyocin S6 family cytotoxin n=1 Tax=Methylobacterium sp. DCY52 TaxID=739139 RepID=UPI0013552467|nr:colicin E3 [Methylobacterium sp. 2A]
MVPPPRTLPGFPAAMRVRPKTPRPGGGLRMRWKDASGAIYEWDYQHGHVEKYDARGSHIGGFDAATGEQVSRADSTRRVEP